MHHFPSKNASEAPNAPFSSDFKKRVHRHASHLINSFCRDQVDKRDAGFTARRLFDFAHRIFRDSASSFSMIYGTIYILQEFIVDTRKATWLLAELSEMATRCKQHIEAGNRMQTTTSQLSMTEAAKLSQQITVRVI